MIAWPTRLDRAAFDPRTVADLLNTLLALSAEIKMILKQHAQQLATIALQSGLQIRMLKPVCLLVGKPAHDQLELLAGAIKPILAASKIRCIPISQRLRQQDFISRRVNFAVTGAEVGDHVGHPSVVDVGVSNADLRHPSALLLPAIAAHPRETPGSRPPDTPPQRRIINKSRDVTRRGG